jgi:hypothetical protein
MRRRRNQASSSLDLFLDTISNTFGGIILVAILLSILVQNRTQEPAQAQETPVTTTMEEMQQLLSTVDNLQALQSQLSAAIAHLESLQPRSDQTELVVLRQQIEQKEKELAGRLQQQLEASQRLAEQMRATAEVTQELQDLDQQLSHLTAALEVEQSALDKAMDEQLEILKLPRVSEVRKSNVILLMRYGKVYATYEAGSDIPFKEHVDYESYSSSSKITPKSGAGWQLSNSADKASLLRYLSQYSPKDHILSVAVWPDSYGDFSALRQIAIEKGFAYQLWPLTEIPALFIVPTSDNLRVQ